MAGSKATKFQEQAATYSYGASKTEQIPKWNCPWTQVEIGGEPEACFEGLSKQNAMLNRDSSLTEGFDATTKIYVELVAQLDFQE